MPRYFFNIHDGDDIPDAEGTVLPGAEKARSQAVFAAGVMLRDLHRRVWQDPDWRMRVTDEHGATVCTLNITGQLGEA